tara:strand:+ start:7419 stop:8915 length:1497 start_codon:yes stop_codon:yes gene_type:complete
MNLKEMRAMVGNILDYNPDVEAYNIEINRILNEVYLEFMTTQPWTFTQQTLDIYTMPDATQTNLQITPQATNSLLFNSVANVNFITGIGATENGSQMSREGDVLFITADAGSGTGKNNVGEYIIDKLEQGTSKAYVSKLSGNRQLVTWEGNAGVARVISATAQERYLALPKDCLQIMSVGIRNHNEAGVGSNALGHIYNLTRSRDEELDLRFDLTGTPTNWIAYDQAPNGYQDYTHFVPRAGKDFHVDTISQSPGWPNGTYEFKCAYVWHGIEGPLSDPQELVIGEGNVVPRFNTVDTTTLGIRGLRKRFYVRLKSLNGLNGSQHQEDFYRDLGDVNFNSYTNQGSKQFPGFIVDDTTTQVAWPQTEFALDTVGKLRIIPRLHHPTTSRWRIRLYPRPAVETPIRVRYVSIPSELQDDFDQPKAPIDTHRYIVYRAIEEAMVKHDNDEKSILYKRKADKELQKIEEKHLTQRSSYYIKSNMRQGPIRVRPYRTLTHLG